MFKKILVSVDGSNLSINSAERSISFAKEAKAELIFLHVKEPFPMNYFGEAMMISAGNEAEWNNFQSKKAEEILKPILKLCEESGIPHHALVGENTSPWASIVDVAESQNCDLIFMASHGRTGLKGLFLGSETQRVLAHTKIPVLVHR